MASPRACPGFEALSRGGVALLRSEAEKQCGAA